MRSSDVNTKAAFAAAAAAVLVIGGAAGFAIGRSTGDHMNQSTAFGSGGHMMGSTAGAGAEWDGPMMQMVGMPGMTMGAGGRMAMGDQAFLAMMIPHHQMALDMAQIVLERGRDAEVKRLATEIISAQKAEIAEMTSWYRNWFGADPPRIAMSGSMAMMGMNMDMGELRSAADPDRAFLRMMIPHHSGAILMADMALAASPRREVAGMARQIVADQSSEIGRMQGMRARIAPPNG